MYRYIRLPFRVAPAGDIFQKKIDKLFIGMLNVYGIADDTFIAGLMRMVRAMMKH